jgi:hypothetical protein
MKRRSKPSGWKEVAALAPRIALTIDEAQALAREWFGEHAEAFPPDPDAGTDLYSVGHWDHALPVGDAAQVASNWPDLFLAGCWSTFASAFRSADPKRWSAYCIKRRVIDAARRRRP